MSEDSEKFDDRECYWLEFLSEKERLSFLNNLVSHLSATPLKRDDIENILETFNFWKNRAEKYIEECKKEYIKNRLKEIEEVIKSKQK